MKKVALQTLGCKLNFTETSAIGRQFRERGFDIVGADLPADVYVLNTCTVTSRADRECRQIVRRFLRTSPDAYIIVAGCYSQTRPEEIASLGGVDLIVGTDEKFDIFRYSGNFAKSSAPRIFVSSVRDRFDFRPSYSADACGRTRAFLKVQDGCDFNCSFCAVPLARGGSRSASIGDIVGQARLIASGGYKEIVLTGVNVGDYGNKNGHGLLELLIALGSLPDIERIRISSVEPDLLNRDIVDFILSSEKFCNHFHVPLQSGSDRVLRKMRRRYSAGDYEAIVSYIRSRDPEAAIGADVIAGFPSETDEFFDETYRFISGLPVTYLHTFPYSDRPGTHSSGFPGKIEPGVRFRRNARLKELGLRKRHEFYSSFIGKTMPVLFERSSDGEGVSGLTPNYIRVTVPGDRMIINKIIDVRLTDICADQSLAGRIDIFSEAQKTDISTI